MHRLVLRRALSREKSQVVAQYERCYSSSSTARKINNYESESLLPADSLTEDSSGKKSKRSSQSKKQTKLRKDKIFELAEEEEHNEMLKRLRRESIDNLWSYRLMRYMAACHATLYSPDAGQATLCADNLLRQAPLAVLKNSTRVFNLVLAKLGQIQEFSKIKLYLDVMEEREVPVDLETVGVLLKLAYQDSNSVKVNLAKFALNMAENNGMQLGKILGYKVNSLQDEQRILDAIRLIKPDFVPDRYTGPEYDFPIEELNYNCELLKDIETPLSKEEYTNDAPLYGIIDNDTLLRKFTEQMKRELDCRIDVPNASYSDQPEVEHLMHGNIPARYQPGGREMRDIYACMLEEWRSMAASAFADHVQRLAQKENYEADENRGNFMLPFLRCLPQNEFIDNICDLIWRIMLSHEAMNLKSHIVKAILGKGIQQRFYNRIQILNGMDQKISNIYVRYLKYFQDPELQRKYNQRQYWLMCSLECYPYQPGIQMEIPFWPYFDLVVKLGHNLLDIMTKFILIDSPFRPHRYVDKFNNKLSSNSKPLLYKIFCDGGCEMREYIRLDSHFKDFLHKSCSIKPTVVLDSVYAPMVCPPIPWHNKNTGRYLFNHMPLVRTSGFEGNLAEKLDEFTDRQDQRKYTAALDTLNQLGTMPWIVNKQVLDVAVKMFNLKVGEPRLAMPADINYFMPSPKIPQGADDAKIVEIYRKRREYLKIKHDTYSVWTTMLYKLSLAQHFRDDVLWFPHSVDFRGRTYPCPPHLNHMGDDLNRGILMFAKGRKLGKKGLDWLKIHCINLTGFKKRASIDERLAYADEVMSEILDSADMPLYGRQWWKTSEEPWQTLSVCFEIAKAVRSPNPEEFFSHCPVHQDGSCNGLQHYAALGRDYPGAEQVNLVPHERPQDVYASVAALVEQRRAHDAERGVDIAKMLEGFVNRKTVKQTVMTIVYGVTIYGARKQIEKQLRETADFPRDRYDFAAKYLSTLTFASIGSLFNNARRIQDWLCDLATIVSRDLKRPLEWVTPLGFPVYQPYLKKASTDYYSMVRHDRMFARRRLFTNKIINKRERHELLVPDNLKQRNAFPPNFIHSLDSSHMMLTSLSCQRKGITFASVHDCYWTHAIDVDVMNKICREQFVALHQVPILQGLSTFVNQMLTEAISQKQSNNVVSDEDVLGKGVLVHKRNKVKRISPIRIIPEVFDTAKTILTEIPPSGDFKLEDVLDSVYFFC